MGISGQGGGRKKKIMGGTIDYNPRLSKGGVWEDGGGVGIIFGKQ